MQKHTQWMTANVGVPNKQTKPATTKKGDTLETMAQHGFTRNDIDLQNAPA